MVNFSKWNVYPRTHGSRFHRIKVIKTNRLIEGSSVSVFRFGCEDLIKFHNFSRTFDPWSIHFSNCQWSWRRRIEFVGILLVLGSICFNCLAPQTCFFDRSLVSRQCRQQRRTALTVPSRMFEESLTKYVFPCFNRWFSHHTWQLSKQPCWISRGNMLFCMRSPCLVEPPWILMVKTPDVVLIGLRFGSPFSGEVPESSWPTVWTEGAFFFPPSCWCHLFCQDMSEFSASYGFKKWDHMGSTGPPDFWLCLSIHQGWPYNTMEHCPKLLRFDAHIGIYWGIYVMYPTLNWFHGCYQSSGNIRTMSNNQWVGGDLSTLFNSELPSPETQQLPIVNLLFWSKVANKPGAPPCGWLMNQPYPLAAT